MVFLENMAYKSAQPTKTGNSSIKFWAISTTRELRALSSGVLFNLILFPALFYSFPAHSAQDILQTGISAYEDDDYQEAIKELEAVITTVTDCEEEILKKATDDPLAALDALSKEDSDTDCGSEDLWNAHTYLAASYLNVDNRPKALEQVKKANSANPVKRPDPKYFSKETIRLFE